MKYVKLYDQFLTEKATNKETFGEVPKYQKYLDIIINYLKEHSDEDLFEYNENFLVHKQGETELYGKLYLTENGKAIRFNFDNTRLHSIDIWEDFEFVYSDIEETICNQPYLTMMINTTIVDGILDDIVDFFENEEPEIYEAKQEEPEFIIKKAVTENVELKTITIHKEVINQNMDVFEVIKLYSMQVASKRSNALTVSGDGGLGKTQEVIDALETLKTPYVVVKGNVSPAGLFEYLFINQDKLIVFDDCNSVWKESESVSILLAALDTYPIRKISRVIKTHFDSTDMTDEEIITKFKETGKLPKQFNFKGQTIFITNVDEEEIRNATPEGGALVTRCLHVDVKLNRQEVLNRMKVIMEKLYPQIPMKIKEETLEFLDYIVNNFPSKSPLNIRSLIHALNIRLSNNFNKKIDGEEVPVWQMLIKTFLIKKETP